MYPIVKKMLDFLNLRAQASARDSKGSGNGTTERKVSFHVASEEESTSANCIACNIKYPLYTCPQFKSLDHDKISLVKAHSYCLNCLCPGHFVKMCRSHHKCKHCQMPHHTSLHVNRENDDSTTSHSTPSHSTLEQSSHAAACRHMGSLLMTCRILVHAADGTPVKARALPDSGSSTSFVSEHLFQSLNLIHTYSNTKIHGIAGIARQSPLQPHSHLLALLITCSMYLILSYPRSLVTYRFLMSILNVDGNI